ncbi:MAG: hypothetical protein ABIA78_03985 [archaeon]
MVKKKNNNLWYIIGGIIIAILLIVLIVMQIQNSEKQKELQKQQDELQFNQNKEKCIEDCANKWNNEQGSCEDFYNKERTNGWMPGSTDSSILDCSDSWPTTENGATCQCKCVCTGLTSNFLI